MSTTGTRNLMIGGGAILAIGAGIYFYTKYKGKPKDGKNGGNGKLTIVQIVNGTAFAGKKIKFMTPDKEISMKNITLSTSAKNGLAVDQPQGVGDDNRKFNWVNWGTPSEFTVSGLSQKGFRFISDDAPKGFQTLNFISAYDSNNNRVVVRASQPNFFSFENIRILDEETFVANLIMDRFSSSPVYLGGYPQPNKNFISTFSNRSLTAVIVKIISPD